MPDDRTGSRFDLFDESDDDFDFLTPGPSDEWDAEDDGDHAGEPAIDADLDLAIPEAPVDEPAEEVADEESRPAIPEDTTEEPAAEPADEREQGDTSLEALAEDLPEAPEAPPLSVTPDPEPNAAAASGSRGILFLGRVLILPRSTFALIASESVETWGPALVLLLLAGVAKAALAGGLTARAGGGGRVIAAVAIRYGIAFVGPIAFAFGAAAAFAFLQQLWRGDAPYRRLLSAVMLALTPIALGDLVQTLYMAVRHKVLLHPGLAALVAPPTRSALRAAAYAVLGTVDVFTLWALVLLTLAVAVSHGRGWVRQVLAAVAVGLVGTAIAALPSLAIASLLAR